MEGGEFGGAIGGVVLDCDSVVFNSDDNENDKDLRPSFVSLLRTLRRSSIYTAISYPPSLSSLKVNFIERLGSAHSVDCFPYGKDARSLVSVKPGVVLHVVSHRSGDLALQLPGSRLVVIGGGDGTEKRRDSSVVCIDKLEELPMTIIRLNREAIGDAVVTVGYTMKPSREEDFAKRGAFPLSPTTRDGLMFLPLASELPLPLQLQQVDMLLHKATDEIVSIDLCGSVEFPDSITFTGRMQELKRYMEQHSDLCVIDPLNNIYPVLDRLKIQQILLGLQDLSFESSRVIRGPRFLKVDDYIGTDLARKLSEAKLCFPSIVKPQVACGVADAHSMAIVFKVEHFKDLYVPLPAIIQEYVDHSSILYKFYVLGDKIFYAVKKSIPNADILMKLSGSPELKPLVFDSLKSLPTSNENQQSENSNCSKKNPEGIDHGLVNSAAMWLKRKLGLTIFGFDVVVEEGSGEHVIVDVNYLPSFKEVPDDVAIPAFWDAIKSKFDSHQTT